jgi:ABC-2 type transport system permease protein
MNLSIVDNDRSPYSTRLVQKVEASEYFHLIDVSNNYQEAMQCIEKGDADLILEIPPHFERDLLKTGVAKVLVSANTVTVGIRAHTKQTMVFVHNIYCINGANV